MPECLNVRNVPTSQMQRLTVHLSGECHLCRDMFIRNSHFFNYKTAQIGHREIFFVITPASSVNECTIVRYLLNPILNCILDVSRIISSKFLLVA